MSQTVDVKRAHVSGRLLDAKLTSDDRDFIRASLVLKKKDFIQFRDSDRLRNLMQMPRRIGN